MIALFFVSLVCSGLSSGVRAADFDLFAAMSGHWVGAGERVYLLSGRKTRIESETFTTVQDGKLVSRNHLREISGTAEREYDAEYWIRQKSSADGSGATYELGYGSQETASAPGKLDDGVFEVVQQFASSPPLMVGSRTRFTSAGSEYEEQTWQGNVQTIETKIVYERVR